MCAWFAKMMNALEEFDRGGEDFSEVGDDSVRPTS
jgi:hypothetical protein